jgi:quercetin dioxygenase-like cupin family protein
MSSQFTIGPIKIKTLIDQHQGPGHLEAFEFTITQENAGPDPHLHQYMDEIFYIISGTLLVDVDNKTTLLKTGDRLIVPKGTKHHWKSQGDEVKMIVIFTPSKGQAVYFTEIEKLQYQGLPWDQTLNILSKQFDVVPL